MTYIPHPQKTEGGQDKMVVSDDNAQSLLYRILKALKIMNVHLSLMTDTYIKKDEEF